MPSLSRLRFLRWGGMPERHLSRQPPWRGGDVRAGQPDVVEQIVRQIFEPPVVASAAQVVSQAGDEIAGQRRRRAAMPSPTVRSGDPVGRFRALVSDHVSFLGWMDAGVSLHATAWSGWGEPVRDPSFGAPRCRSEIRVLREDGGGLRVQAARRTACPDKASSDASTVRSNRRR